MAEVAVDEIPQAEKDELFCTYAAMILADSELEIDEENIKKLIKAAGGKVDGFYSSLFAKMVAGKAEDIGKMCVVGGGGGGGGGGAAAPVAAAGGGDAGAAKKEEKKEEEEEEEDMEFDLFG
eukprot:gnl/TRDRNA2_/TRDRNA2_131907_c0_seq1.p2 gnl/TRDRNA2_/TRDRNA2_131907_c0~~gnl/TRDRNA2_/TRDRNA2_131907_c0_seq1.p2  ORF type:complete len:122 (+),score=59.57 gnl/TRDRNA2_/TRDRNA2_131907_c0_seq1:85-450(+)